MDAATRKRKGVHYTPLPLARFLAEKTIAAMDDQSGSIDVLDPACGDGMLLSAFAEASDRDGDLTVHGVDIETSAIDATRAALPGFDLRLHQGDFLDWSVSTDCRFDAAISNPPYVRTQVLGEQQSRELATRFGLTGRVDLYHAFVVGLEKVLKPGGVLGLLTSNRFLTTKAGASMRSLLSECFELRAIYDLGDTRLFSAAVLPAVLIASKKPSASARCRYTRVYRNSDASEESMTEDLFAAIDNDDAKNVSTDQGAFQIDRGWLQRQPGYWSLINSESESWLNEVLKNRECSFGELAEIKVGIKTTADSVFIRRDWKEIEPAPEADLLQPLLTHHDAARWVVPNTTQKRVLYPYQSSSKKRVPVSLTDFPNANQYLQGHRPRLAGRKYVIEAGREWFEIWVPHQPSEWKAPKIVCPDISEQPRFFLDYSGAIVNGDCYWIKLKPGVENDWLYLMLAVANSSVAVKFYDIVFHNKLYAGRRRFMTQYVKEFPLPRLDSPAAISLVELVKDVIEQRTVKEGLDQEVDRLVTQTFGL